MSISYQEGGRTQQKARTRKVLVDAARRLLADGREPTVEAAARSASVSRATAYRYFPNQRALMVAAHPEVETRSLLGAEPPADPRARIRETVDALISLTLEAEPQLRATLRLSLEPGESKDDGLALRRGRAIGWLEDALSPLAAKLKPARLRRLVLAIRSACGIEALVWLTDVGGLSRRQAAETMRWSAAALFEATLGEAEVDGRSPG